MKKQNPGSPLHLGHETLARLATGEPRIDAAASTVVGASCPVVSCLAKCHPLTTTC